MNTQNLRVKNTCRQCGSTWSPRGTTTSNMCPECGSQEIEVKTRPAPRKKRGFPIWLAILGVLLIGGGGVTALVLTLNNNTESTHTTDTAPKGKDGSPPVVESPFKVGDVVQVKKRARNVLLADVDAADELAKLQQANDGTGLKRLLKLNKVAQIPEGTKATVLGVSPVGVRVKITDGGWTDREGILSPDVLEVVK